MQRLAPLLRSPVAPVCGALTSFMTVQELRSQPRAMCSVTPSIAPEFTARVKIVPYGILGSGSKGQLAPAPDAKTAFVDPAGLHHIKPPGGPSGAGGAAGVIYKWLGISSDPSFPQPVVDAIGQSLQAKFFSYGDDGGKKCIHVVGPDLREGNYTRETAVNDLACAYRNVLSEFCLSGLPRLRLLPVSGGIFSGPFKDQLPYLTAEALESGYVQLSRAQQEQILMADIEMCIFMEREVPAFERAFADCVNAATTARL